MIGETPAQLAERLGIPLNNTGAGTGAQQQVQRLALGANISATPQTAEPWKPWNITEAIAMTRVKWSYGGYPTTTVNQPWATPQMDVPRRATVTEGIAGDEYKSVLDGLGYFATLDPNSMGAIQAALYNHGYIKNKKWQNFGQPDETSVRAWQTAMIRAVRAGKTVWEMLGGKGEQDVVMNGQSAFADATARIGAASAPKRAPLSIRYSNPEDLKEAARQTALDTIGYVPGDKFLGDFVKLYHGMEAGAQRSNYAGKNFTDPGNPAVQAQEELQEDYSTQASAYSTVKAFDSFLSIIGADQGVAGVGG